MNEKISFNNTVILIYDTIVLVEDEYGSLFFVDNDGNEYAYELGDCVSSDDLTPFSELSKDLQKKILEEI